MAGESLDELWGKNTGQGRRNSTKGSGTARGMSLPQKPDAWWAFSCHFDAAAC